MQDVKRANILYGERLALVSSILMFDIDVRYWCSMLVSVAGANVARGFCSAATRILIETTTRRVTTCD